MKQLLAYTRYFFYLAFNWNLPLALFIIKHEIRGEKKYGLNTTGIDDLTSSVPECDRINASIYQPVNFYTAEMLMNQLNTNDLTGGFLDVGCGKGRMLAVAAAYGLKRISGIDFSAQLCHEAIQHASKIEHNFKGAFIEIECADARFYNIPGEVSVIFMFNPFDDLVMADFLKQVSATLDEWPRQLKILYANPVCRKQLLNAGFTEIYSFKKMVYLEGSVFVFKPKTR